MGVGRGGPGGKLFTCVALLLHVFGEMRVVAGANGQLGRAVFCQDVVKAARGLLGLGWREPTLVGGLMHVAHVAVEWCPALGKALLDPVGDVLEVRWGRLGGAMELRGRAGRDERVEVCNCYIPI